jgi:hypothetical protein
VLLFRLTHGGSADRTCISLFGKPCAELAGEADRVAPEAEPEPPPGDDGNAEGEVEDETESLAQVGAGSEAQTESPEEVTDTPVEEDKSARDPGDKGEGANPAAGFNSIAAEGTAVNLNSTAAEGAAQRSNFAAAEGTEPTEPPGEPAAEVTEQVPAAVQEAVYRMSGQPRLMPRAEAGRQMRTHDGMARVYVH